MSKSEPVAIREHKKASPRLRLGYSMTDGWGMVDRMQNEIGEVGQ